MRAKYFSDESGKIYRHLDDSEMIEVGYFYLNGEGVMDEIITVYDSCPGMFSLKDSQTGLIYEMFNLDNCYKLENNRDELKIDGNMKVREEVRQKVCDCESRDLFLYGCKCGGV